MDLEIGALPREGDGGGESRDAGADDDDLLLTNPASGHDPRDRRRPPPGIPENAQGSCRRRPHRCHRRRDQLGDPRFLRQLQQSSSGRLDWGRRPEETAEQEEENGACGAAAAAAISPKFAVMSGGAPPWTSPPPVADSSRVSCGQRFLTTVRWYMIGYDVLRHTDFLK